MLRDITEAQKAMLVEASRGEYLKVQDLTQAIANVPVSHANEKAAFNLALRGFLTRHPHLEDRQSAPGVSVWQITSAGLQLVKQLQP